MGFDDLNSPLVGNQQRHGASAPPSGSLYPQIVSPGAMQPPNAGHAVGVPASAASPVIHASTAYVPAAAPPPGYPVPEQHLHLHVPDNPVITRVDAEPRFTTCPACGYSGPSAVKRESGLCTYAACIGLWWVFCPLFWLPFCLDCDKDLVHRCGVCSAELARTKPC